MHVPHRLEEARRTEHEIPPLLHKHLGVEDEGLWPYALREKSAPDSPCPGRHVLQMATS